VATSGFPDDPVIPRLGQDLIWSRDVVAPFFGDMFIMKDRLDQLRKRRVVHARFTPGVVERWRPTVRRALKQLLDELEPRGHLEVMQDLAVPLSLHVSAEMMGVPAVDRPFVRAVSEKLMAVYGIGPDSMRQAVEGIEEFTQYLESLMAARRANPTEDLLTVLMDAEESGVYSHRELCANAVLLMLTGQRTATNLMCNGLVALLQHPDEWRKLRLDPEDRARSATEESLRWHPSPMLTERLVGDEPVEVAGKTLRPQQRLRLVHLAANRDPRRFEDPDVFLVDRHPNPHLSFGGGTHHHGLDSALARLQTQEMFVAMADRFKRPELVTDPVEYHPSVLARTPIAVEISW
jgi:cytochrome P450